MKAALALIALSGSITNQPVPYSQALRCLVVTSTLANRQDGSEKTKLFVKLAAHYVDMVKLTGIDAGKLPDQIADEFKTAKEESDTLFRKASSTGDRELVWFHAGLEREARACEKALRSGD